MKFNSSYFGLLLFFPWLGSGLNSFDTQPWVSALLLVLFLSRIGSISARSLFIVSVLFLGVVMFQSMSLLKEGGGDLILFIRGIAGIFVSFFSVLYFSSLNASLLTRMVYMANIIYLFFGVFQLLFGYELTLLLFESRTSPLRGVTSLTPEPTFFGLVLLVFLVFNLYFTRNYFIVVLNVIGIFFLAKSSTAIIGALVVLFVWAACIRVNIFYKILFLFLVGVMAVVPMFVELGRVSSLYTQLLDLPRLLSNDFSVKVRLSDVVSPYIMTFHNFLLPIGFGDVSLERGRVMGEAFNGMLDYESTANRTNSFLGDLLISAGVFYIFFVFWFMYKFSRLGVFRVFVTILIVSIFSIPINSIFISLLYSFALIYDWRYVCLKKQHCL